MQELMHLFRRAPGVIDSGCVVVGGSEAAGPKELFVRLVEQACQEKLTLIVLDGKQNATERTDLINNHILPRLNPGSLGYVFCSDLGLSDKFDPLSACKTSLEKASLIADLLIIHSMRPEHRGDVVTYFQYVMEVTRSGRLRDILKMDPRSVSAALSPSDPDAEMKQIFLDD